MTLNSQLTSHHGRRVLAEATIFAANAVTVVLTEAGRQKMYLDRCILLIQRSLRLTRAQSMLCSRWIGKNRYPVCSVLIKPFVGTGNAY
jgi:hypothetical protein